MRNTLSRETTTQGQQLVDSPHWRALRACENRIRELQSLRPSRDQGELLHRRAQLREQASTALRQAHACVTQGDFRTAEPGALAGMVNVFTRMRKYPVSQEMDAIVACIGREVEQRAATETLASWSPRNLSMMANALSKSQGPVAGRALACLARTLLDIPAQQLAARPGWYAQPLALMVNALSKAEDASTRQALAHMAQALPAAEQLVPELGWSAQHLAMIANGLGKSEGKKVQEALRRLAQAISQQDLVALRRWDARDLSMLVNGLSKVEGRDIDEALAHLAQALPAACWLTQASGWTALPLAMMANGLGKGEGPAVQKALSQLAQALPEVHGLTAASGWNAGHLAMMANGLSKGTGTGVREALVRLAQAILMRPQLTAEQGWNARNLSLVAHAVTRDEATQSRAVVAHLARGLLMVPRLTLEAGWYAQPLALMANALGRSPGPDALTALERLAQAILDGRPLTVHAGWTAQSLSMIAAGLAKGRGPSVKPALERLAGVVRAQVPLDMFAWTAQRLAMMIQGLGKGEGRAVSEALTHLARAVIDQRQRRPHDWVPPYIGMTACGLAHGEGACIREALTSLAAGIPDQRQLTPEYGWTFQCLALAADGLGRHIGPEIQEALCRLAQAVLCSDPPAAQRGSAHLLALTARGLCRTADTGLRQAVRTRLAQWACQLPLVPEQEDIRQNLLVLLDATGQTLAGQTLLEQITAAAVSEVRQAPQWLRSVLGCLARFALCASHLKSASRLLEALAGQDVGPCSGRERREMLWSITLCHFACQQQQPVDQTLARSFMQAWHRCLHGQLAEDRAAMRPVAGSHAWQDLWVRDYWQPSVMARREVAVSLVDAIPAASGRQSRVFERLRQDLPDHDVRQAVRINHCPVDILIDGRLCVLTDGPDQLVEVPVATAVASPVPVTTEAQPGTLFVQQARTRDLFVDHMLRQYGYRVFHIDQPLDTARFDARILQLVRALGVAVAV